MHNDWKLQQSDVNFIYGRTLESGAAQQWNWLCVNCELQAAAEEESSD